MTLAIIALFAVAAVAVAGFILKSKSTTAPVVSTTPTTTGDQGPKLP